MFTAIFWKKTWSWIKHHWYFPVILVLIIIFSLSRTGSTKRLFELMETRREQHKKEVELLNQEAEDKKKKVDDAIRTHQEALEKVEKDHDLEVKNLEKEKRQELDMLIKKHEGSPDKLAEEVARLLGAEHVETL